MRASRWGQFLLLLVGMAAAWAADAPHTGTLVLSTRGFARTSVLDRSAGKEAITAFRFEVPYGLAPGWRLPYLGFSEGATGTIQLNAVAVTLPGAQPPVPRLAVTFGGQPGVTVAPNAVVESDPVDQPVAPGAVVMVWTYYRNQDAHGALPYMRWGYVDRCDGCLVGDVGTLSADRLGDEALLRTTAPPAPLFAGAGALIRSYQPIFITGRPSPAFTGTPLAIGFIGDSINIAEGDFGRVTPDDPFPARGWNGRACGVDTPYVVFGQSGSNAGGFLGAQNMALFKYIFGTGAGDARVSALIDGYGINELRQQTKTKAPDKVWRDRLAVADIAHRLGLPYVHTTLTPMRADFLIFDHTMGDRVARFAAFTAERNTFNTRVRRESTNIPGCVGIIDWGQSVETDPGAGDNLWQPGVTMEGIHPNTEGFQRMSKVAATAVTALRTRLTPPRKVEAAPAGK